VECTPEYLLQFAYMGSFYAQKQMGIAKPKVGLMNNGAEASCSAMTDKNLVDNVVK
jgi:glycerol-3-phosphate acyltransferase PlsX